LLFDATVFDKSYSFEIAGVRSHYSGNAHGVVKGIGIVNLVYYHATTDQYWIIDYRIFDPNRDGKTKLDHVNEMLDLVAFRALTFKLVLMDAWYATTQLMTRLHRTGKLFYCCPIKKNRLVDDSGGELPYRAVETLAWTNTEEATGKTIKMNKLSSTIKLKLFGVIISTDRTD